MTSAQILEIRRRLAAGVQSLDYATALELLQEVDRLNSACEHARKLLDVQGANFKAQIEKLEVEIKLGNRIIENLRTSDTNRKYTRLKQKLEDIFDDDDFTDE